MSIFNLHEILYLILCTIICTNTFGMKIHEIIFGVKFCGEDYMAHVSGNGIPLFIENYNSSLHIQVW